VTVSLTQKHQNCKIVISVIRSLCFRGNKIWLPKHKNCGYGGRKSPVKSWDVPGLRPNPLLHLVGELATRNIALSPHACNAFFGPAQGHGPRMTRSSSHESRRHAIDSPEVHRPRTCRVVTSRLRKPCSGSPFNFRLSPSSSTLLARDKRDMTVPIGIESASEISR